MGEVLPLPSAVYADGGIIGRDNPSLHGGTWAFVWVNGHGREICSSSGLVLPGSVGMNGIENNLSELYAIVKALDSLPDGWSGKLYSDSGITMGRLFYGWKWNGIPATLKSQAAMHFRRLGTVQGILLSGHPTRSEMACGISKEGRPVSEHNVRCDKLCKEEAARYLAELRSKEETKNLLGRR